VWFVLPRTAHITTPYDAAAQRRIGMTTTALRLVQLSPQASTSTLGVFPFLPVARLETIFAPIAADFARVLRRPVSLQTRASYAQFAESLHQQTFDLALVQPFDYVRTAAAVGYVPLARLRAPMYPLVVVQPHSTVKRLEDLRGTVVALPPAQAAASLMMKYALVQADMQPLRDITLRYFRTHHSCLQQVLVGTARACVTMLSSLRSFETAMHTTLRIVATLPSIPGPLFVSRPGMLASERYALIATITSWHQTEAGRAMLQRAGFDTFIPAADSDYDLVRIYWKEIEAHDTEVVPQIPHCRDDCFAGGGRDDVGAVANLVDVIAGQP
jgi:phosphonate transport system substrate-binding protein